MGLVSKLWILGLVAGTFAQQSLKIQVSKEATHAIPSTLYGQMWEDINRSGDGGLYAELLQNRAFQAVKPGTLKARTGWEIWQGASIQVVDSVPGVSAALPNSLEVTVSPGPNGPSGFQNTGYWGIKIESGWKYTGSFYARSSKFTGPITVSLLSAELSGTVFASKVLKGVSSSWKKFTFEFQPEKSAINSYNVFRVTFDATPDKKVYFGMFSLFPPTYRNRPNGMRIDLAEALAATKPGVWRFPGGNNLEGHSIKGRWKWDETIGPLENRPGRLGDWGYTNTDGLGLMEYFQWVEDIGAVPILGVWAGLSLANSGKPPVVPENQIQPYVQEVINEIQFLTGDAKSNKWAKLRAQYGHPEPYNLKYIEIGNEDFFGSDSYARYRWKAFVNGLKAAFPNSNFEYIATTLPSTALDPPYAYIDFHQYNTPAWFIENALQFDKYPRNGTHWFIGEYAVTSTSSSCILGSFSCGRFRYPTLQGAVAEAAYMTGLERNSDVVFASAYAPTLQNIQDTQWTPNLISFDAGTLVKSASYYVQLMFSTNLGTHVLKTSPAPSAKIPLHWVASHNARENVVYVKVANTANDAFVASFTLDFPLGRKSSTVTHLNYRASDAYNTLDKPKVVVPKATDLKLDTGTTRFNYTLPGYSVAVFKLKVNW